MKTFILIGFFVLILFVLDGCTVYKTSACHLSGNCRVVQPGYVVQLDVTKARYIYFGRRSDGLHLVWDSQGACDANAFLFTFFDNKKSASIDSITASYQYSKNSLQPLELMYLDKTNAVFLLKTNSPTCLEYGRYKLNVQYAFNGESNSCNFDLNYVEKYKTHFVFFWNYLGFMWAEHGGGGP